MRHVGCCFFHRPNTQVKFSRLFVFMEKVVENLPKHLKEKYLRDRACLPDDEELPSGIITYSDVLIGYYFLIDYFENLSENEKMFAGLGNPNLLASAISRQAVSFGGVSKWADPLLISSSLFFGLVKNHAFFDGNKRIALLMLLKSLLKQKRVVIRNQTVFEDFTVATAAGALRECYPDLYDKNRREKDVDIYIIRDFIKRRSRPLAQGFYGITFRELNTVLSKHGFEMGDPDGNSIRVYRVGEKKGFFGIGKRQIVKTRVCNIGFPSWTKQVSARDLHNLREATGLTLENGYDNSVLFGGSEPLYKLIHDFEGPLKRLIDR